MISKADVRERLLDWLNSHENCIGMDTYPLLAEFIEKEKICPEVVGETLSDLAMNYTKLANGRVLIPYEPTQVTFGERFSDELWAHKTFHTGAITCPRK